MKLGRNHTHSRNQTVVLNKSSRKDSQNRSGPVDIKQVNTIVDQDNIELYES